MQPSGWICYVQSSNEKQFINLQHDLASSSSSTTWSYSKLKGADWRKSSKVAVVPSQVNFDLEYYTIFISRAKDDFFLQILLHSFVQLVWTGPIYSYELWLLQMAKYIQVKWTKGGFGLV